MIVRNRIGWGVVAAGLVSVAPAHATDLELTWNGACYQSQVGASGSVTLTKTFNGVNHDVTLDGSLSIFSATWGYVRHELPLGFRPNAATSLASCAVQDLAGFGSTAAIGNYVGMGVFVYADTMGGYENGALWFPERNYNGTYTLSCAWQTDEATNEAGLAACGGITIVPVPTDGNGTCEPTDVVDTDGDGVADECDVCAATAGGLYDLDADGCPDDSDADGLVDEMDLCRFVVAGPIDLNADGCPDDSDGDLLPDASDACPYVAAGTFDVDDDGCPDDSDGDGIADQFDACVAEATFGFDADMNGCPDDSDGDGVYDFADLCAGVDASGYDLNGDGCLDNADGDDLLDHLDGCPTEAAPPGDADGCPNPPDLVLDWTGGCYQSQVGASGSVTLTKTFNGTNHDVTLDGTLTIFSATWGYVRHELPPGFRPDAATSLASCAVQDLAGFGSTAAIGNYVGMGVFVYADTMGGYENGALWFPERNYNGTYTLSCAWRTDDATSLAALASCGGVTVTAANTDGNGTCEPTDTVDTDGDGVKDECDACPAVSGLGWDGDADGCLDDGDGDGVTDNVDTCPTEDATGYDGDGDGCLDDSDIDGVTDDRDVCPAVSAAGFDTNDDGCVDDTDGDGLTDDVDACPAVSALNFDADLNGCLDDSDADGVTDDIDACAGENAAGYDVNGDGCLDDSDGDGLTDNVDACPSEDARGNDLDGDGCLDASTDGNGVCEGTDVVDSDSDSLVDDCDACADEAGPGPDGCPEPAAPTGHDVTFDWNGGCWSSQVGASGLVTLNKVHNGTNYDVTLTGTLTIYSPTWGYTRHELPPGFRPTSATHLTSCTVQDLAGYGSTAGVGLGVHVQADTFVNYENGALWFPERSFNGTYTLECAWRTAELTDLPALQACGGVELPVSGTDGNGACEVTDVLDGDLDAVVDDCDACPAVSALGYDLDGDGCLDDTDGDGLTDDVDACPALDARGVDDDGDGCPDDLDGDGVPNGTDRCPGFDDALDGDGDSVPDGCDACAGSDDAADADGDGVADGCDSCAGSDDAADADSDAVPDACDVCVGDDAADEDGDGVPNACDQCANAPDQVDSDGDGVADGCDACPDVANDADRDEDGVPDCFDLCPDVPATSPELEPDGCPAAPDADVDGIPDDEDTCFGDNSTGDVDADGVCEDQDACEGDDASGDADLDGYCAETVGGAELDCDDAEALSFPGAEESCNGLDDDCDGLVPNTEADLNENGIPDCTCLSEPCRHGEFYDDQGSFACASTSGRVPGAWLLLAAGWLARRRRAAA